MHIIVFTTSLILVIIITIILLIIMFKHSVYVTSYTPYFMHNTFTYTWHVLHYTLSSIHTMILYTFCIYIYMYNIYIYMHTDHICICHTHVYIWWFWYTHIAMVSIIKNIFFKILGWGDPCFSLYQDCRSFWMKRSRHAAPEIDKEKCRSDCA